MSFPGKKTELVRTPSWISALSVFFLFGLIFFHRNLFLGELLEGGDLNYQYYIWKDFFVRSIWRGVFPFWNPYPFCGTPFFHEIQTATLYPPDLIYFFLDLPWAFGVSFLLHFVAAGFGFYLFSGLFLSCGFGRLFAGLAYMASGFLTSRLFVGEPTVTQGYALAPYFLWTGIQLFDKPSTRKAGGFSLFSAVFILAGHPQIPFLIVQLLGVFLVYRSLQKLREGSDSVTIFRSWGSLVAAGTLGFLAVVVQTGPFLQLAGYSATRSGGADYTFASEGSLPVNHLITFLLPLFFGDPTRETYWGSLIPFMEICGYIGVSTLLLVFVSVLFNRTKTVAFWFLVLLAALLVSLGHFTPVHWWMYRWFPGWNLFRNPNRALLVVTISGCILAGIGVETLFAQNNSDKRRRMFMGIAVCLVILLLLLATMGGCLVAEKGKILVGFASAENMKLLEHDPHAEPAYVPGNFIHRYRGMVRAVSVGIAIVSVFLFWLLLWYRLADRKWIPGWILIAFLAVDLFVFGQRFLVTDSPQEWREKYFPPSRLTRELSSSIENGRLLVPDEALDYRLRDKHPEIFPNGPMLYRIRTVRGYCSTILKHYSEFINLAQNKPKTQLPGGFLFLDKLESIDPLALGVMGVRWVVDYKPVPRIFHPVKRFSGGLSLYSYPQALPRVFRAEPAENRWGFAPVPRELDQSRIEEQEMNRLVVDTSGPGPATLVFSDCFFPGWTATVDGRRVPVRRVFHTFMGVEVPAGVSHVIFRFKPEHWNLFCLISCFSTICILGCLLLKNKGSEIHPQIPSRSG